MNKLAEIMPYSRDTALLLVFDNIYWFDQHTGKMSPFFDVQNKYHKGYSPLMKIGGTAAFLNDRNHFYVVSPTLGLHYLRFENDSLSDQCLNNERFNDMVYDPLRHHLWVYNSYDLEIYNTDGSELFSFSGEKLKELKI